jgi:IclR family transcriptional regulator, pca regulon regulatory protein
VAQVSRQPGGEDERPRQRRGGHEWSPRQSDGELSQSLERGILILECFTAERPVRGIQDIATDLQMSPGTVDRYVGSLVAQGLLDRISHKEYRLGLAGIDLGLATVAEMGLRELSDLPLQELARRTHFTSSSTVLDGSDVLVIRCVPGYRGGRPAFVPKSVVEGSRQPTYCTAAGKVLLAGLSASQRDQLLELMVFTQRTPRTLTSLPSFRDELRQVSEDGFALEESEFQRSLLAMAAPVWDDSGEVIAAVTLSASSATTSIAHLRDALAPQLRVAAGELSTWLCYRGRGG